MEEGEDRGGHRSWILHTNFGITNSMSQVFQNLYLFLLYVLKIQEIVHIPCIMYQNNV
mgnify:FL=1